MNEPNNEPLVPQNGKQVSDVDRLMATCARLLREKIDERSKAITLYDQLRMTVLDNYRVSTEKLRQDTEGELRRLTIEHEDYLRKIDEIVSKLSAVRDA